MSDGAQSGTLSGRRFDSWAEAAPALGAATCAWQGLDGLRHGSAPTEWPPGATHLWAWDDDVWWLARADRWGVTLSRLATTTSEWVGSEQAAAEFEVYDAEPWGDTEGRLSPAARAARPGRVEVAEVIGEAPVQFLRLGF